MISRVADHCFWLGRYLERVESTARVLNVTATIALDGNRPPQDGWRSVLIVCGQEPEFVALWGDAAAVDGSVVQNYMTWNEQNSTSVLRSLLSARENARSIREVISLEVWRVINELYVWLTGEDSRYAYAQNRDGFYEHIRRSMQLCLGLMRSTMLHDAPLNFIWLGMLLERTGQTARLLDVHHHALTESAAHPSFETALWMALLRACSGFEPFFKRYQGRISGQAVASFLIFEPKFPRSLRYSVHSAYQRFCQIRPAEEVDRPGERSLGRLHELDTWLRSLEPLPLADVHEFLTRLVDRVEDVCNEITTELLE